MTFISRTTAKYADMICSSGSPEAWRGTPAMYAENGELLGGYLPPDQLLESLEALAN